MMTGRTGPIERRYKWQMLEATAYEVRHFQGRVPIPPELLQLVRPPTTAREFVAEAAKVRLGNVRHVAWPWHAEHFCNAVQGCLASGQLVRIVQGLRQPPESVAQGRQLVPHLRILNYRHASEVTFRLGVTAKIVAPPERTINEYTWNGEPPLLLLRGEGTPMWR